jgi:hypothetical protein
MSMKKKIELVLGNEFCSQALPGWQSHVMELPLVFSLGTAFVNFYYLPKAARNGK